MEYAQGCHAKWDAEKRALWFKTYWIKMVNKFSDDIPYKLNGVFDGTVGGRTCRFSHGF